MGIRKSAAETASALSTAALKHVFRRPAANFPGKLALAIDPGIVAESADKLRRGSICVVGTNGKTTVTNMLADCLEAAGQHVVCNRTGANLDSGVATSLLHAQTADWGVFECDELWLAKILPALQSRYVVLLNLFRDQLDRVGEIDRIQESIVGALEASPRTVLVYNADDPHCERIARAVPNANIPFGIGEDLGLPQGSVGASPMCQECDGMLSYEYRSYGQLGAYSCPQCDFARAHLKFMARNCTVGAEGMSFDVFAAVDDAAVAGGAIAHIDAPYSGAYMVYNLLAVYASAHSVGLSNNVIQLTMDAYDPHNGRLEQLQVHGRSVLLNLAKNPTGFNQNIALVLQQEGPAAVAFFVNDKEGDGRDVSWLWDVDFEGLAGRQDVVVYCGGMRANDLQVRLKYAGVPAAVVKDATDAMCRIAGLPEGYKVFMIANYTSLPDVRADCVKMTSDTAAPVPTEEQRRMPDPLPAPDQQGDPVRIVHLLPDLLNLYGDGGNIAVLEKRLAWRGIPAQVEHVGYAQDVDLSKADIVFVGGGPDREQRLASTQLAGMRQSLVDYVEDGGVLLAICGGFQILGAGWYAGEEEVAGLGLVDVHTDHADAHARRITGDVVLRTDIVQTPVVGYENHAGRTRLGQGVEPFGAVLSGVGNNEGDKTDGVRKGNLVASYLHGPLLAKNPEVADWLIARALERRGRDVALSPLDDSIEMAANSFMLDRLGI